MTNDQATDSIAERAAAGCIGTDVSPVALCRYLLRIGKKSEAVSAVLRICVPDSGSRRVWSRSILSGSRPPVDTGDSVSRALAGAVVSIDRLPDALASFGAGISPRKKYFQWRTEANTVLLDSAGLA